MRRYKKIVGNTFTEKFEFKWLSMSVLYSLLNHRQDIGHWHSLRMFCIGSISNYMNHTFLVLIPKNDNAMNFNNFRAISLCNFIYKIVSRISTFCKQNFEEDNIPKSRSCCWRQLDCRKSHNCIKITRMIKKHKKKDVLILIKLDIKKACNKVQWSCLVDVTPPYPRPET